VTRGIRDFVDCHRDPNFATQYLARNKVAEDFDVTPQVLNEFKVFCSGRGIRPGVGEWSAEREFISNRIKTEIFNQSFGVAKSDEVEAQRDPVIQKAMEEMGG
jgi:carboxyl-terminal processing protease